VTKQSSAAAETITLDGTKINGGNAYSIIGGTVEVITGDGAGGTIDVQIGGSSVLAAAQSTNAAGNVLLVLSDTVGDLSGVAGDDITIITTQAAKCQVTLFLSGTLDNVV
jgi:hypothetical protein